MIKASELRIGNKVRQAHAHLTVLSVGERTAICTDFNYGPHPCTYKNLDPITLTPEILEACGFKIDEDGDYCYKDYYFGWDGTTLVYNATPIYFVHQLQNLFFALSGEELQVNLQTVKI